jgi:hypothetical protein
MAVLTLERRHHYGDPTKGHPQECVNTNCTQTRFMIFPYDIYMVSITAICWIMYGIHKI